MVETLLITFREGLEAFLIVAIMLAYLTKTGRFNLIQPVYYGIGLALLISATTGYHIQELAEDPIAEGILALIAGALVATLTVYVMRTAKTIRQDIHDRLEKHAAHEDDTLAEIGIFFFTALMIAREGMETALMLGTISSQTGALGMLAGAAGGLALVAVIGYFWIKQSHKINLKLFMQVTGIFLVLFSVHLFLYGLHELSEMQALPLPENMNIAFHHMTEGFEPSAPLGQVITYSLLVIPVGWLLFSYFRGNSKKLEAAE